MTISVAQITQIDALKLTVLAGRPGLKRTVRWVHVAEVADPTPWLRGNEFLLTTGLMLDSVDPRTYVERLNESSVSALGFGVGIVYDEVPPELIAAADDVGLPLVRVPLDTPYVAISETVSLLLTEQKVNNAERIASSQKALVRAALMGETQQVLSAAATLIDGWVVTTDRHGACAPSVPAHMAERIEPLRSDLQRMSSGHIPAGSVIVHGEVILIQPILQNDAVWGFVIAGAKAMREFERYVVSSAVALLTLEASLEYRFRKAEHERRRLALRSLLADSGKFGGGAEQLDEWGFSSTRVRLAVATAEVETLNEILRRIIGYLSSDSSVSAAVGVIEEQFLALVIDEDHFEPVQAFLTRTLASDNDIGVALGPVVDLAYAPSSYRSLKRIAGDGRARSKRLVQAESTLSLEFILAQATDRDALVSFSQGVLGPLFLGEAEDAENGALKGTLRVFLESDGRWREASERLGIHRHTLRRRVEHLEKILERNLNSSFARMELWFALLAEESLKNK